jgi:hypothetical protein
MTPANILVIDLDGNIHTVTTRTPITISAQLAPLVDITTIDPETLEATVVQGRLDHTVTSVVATRYTCGCGLGIDLADAAIDGDARFTQDIAATCPGC